MNRELEAVLLALDAWKEARGPDAERFEMLFESRLEDVAERHPGLSRETLRSLIERQHRRWVLAQKKPTALPPKA